MALHKRAFQSSTWGNQVASKAVDGRKGDEACTTSIYSGNDVHGWWAVDLGAAYNVGRVTVTNDRNPKYRKYH